MGQRFKLTKSSSKVFFLSRKRRKMAPMNQEWQQKALEERKKPAVSRIFSIILRYLWNSTSAPLGMEGTEHVSLSSLGCPNRAAGNSALEPSVSDPFPEPAASGRSSLWSSLCFCLQQQRKPLVLEAGGWEWRMEFVLSPALGEVEALTVGHWFLNSGQRPRAEWRVMEPKLRERMQYKAWAHTTGKNKEFGTAEP